MQMKKKLSVEKQGDNHWGGWGRGAWAQGKGPMCSAGKTSCTVAGGGSGLGQVRVSRG